MENIDIYEELENLKDFVYSVKGQKFILGYGIFLNCTSKIEKLYDDFIKKAQKAEIEIQKDNPKKRVVNDSIESFNLLLKAINEIAFNKIDDDYGAELYSFADNLAIEERKKILAQKELFILFLGLNDKYQLKFDISLNDLDKLKKLKWQYILQ